MTAGTIVFWRHGQTEYNAAQRLQGQVDIPLNDLGRRQAVRAAEVLAVERRPTHVVSSDLSRAVDTAQALAERTGLAVRTDARLRERGFGAWEGRTHEEIRSGWPEAFASWRRGNEPEGVGAETRAEAGQRVAAAVAATAEDLHDDDVLLVVAHGAAITLAQSVLLGLDPGSWFGMTGLDNCRWSTLLPNPGRAPAWRLSSYNVGVPAEA
ncbi:histidine phosphatase family protein [Georgenia sp. 10Sc9-8]|uniref:Histidine phosphatase family protein n=1 Tax=Georgenia halotolerans TaxID=3028317 RepID=A0ABT5U020_9MICO|nr:histidine phosphatase family protein [Georgenia halotolerans]